MTFEEYRSAIMDVVYLSACAVEGRTPDAGRVERMDLTALFRAADRHLLTGITAAALESAGVKDAAFKQSLGMAIRREALFDLERAAVLEKLEEAGIWYLPLKGCILKDLYPAIGMRQMADNDILYDNTRTDEVRAIMEGLGFSTDENFGRGVHDHYLKPPVINFEMHRTLFAGNHDGRLKDYYREVKSRLLLNEGSRCGYHFSDADFYLYLLAHEYKHYAAGGTGLRSVLDTWVYLRAKQGALDWDYIAEELEKLGLTDFEARNRSLALHLFAGDALTEADARMLDYILSSGTYGTLQNRVNNRLAECGNGPLRKVRYTARRIFLPMKVIRASFPVFAKYPVLLPALPFYRVFRGLKKNPGRMRAELGALKKS